MMPPVPRPGPEGTEPIGALLTRLRLARGLSQLRLAELLCASAGVPTVTRHEISRWEREERVPGAFWLGWLALVLDAPPDLLERAAAGARRAHSDGPGARRLWHPPHPGELPAMLDGTARGDDLRTLAHAWLAGPVDPTGGPGPRGSPHHPGPVPGDLTGGDGDPAAPGPVLLADLRRMDDLVGGADLASRVDRHLRDAITGTRGTAGRRPLRAVAQWAQLAGWVHADAGDPVTARRAYRVALRTAAAAGDRALAAHVLGCVSHLQVATGEAGEALLAARTAHTGGRGRVPASVRALVLQRLALAAARTGERRAAEHALAASERALDRTHPEREPSWLYWLDSTELAAMTGRCLVALGRPVRAIPLLASRPPRHPRGHRTTALYGCWLARAYLDLGEVEQACEVATGAWPDAVRAGSVRTAALLRQLHRMLLHHREVPAVRAYQRLTAPADPYLAGPESPQRAAATR
jgi:transcriptional regulator with XRE-family HTH domain